MTQVFKTIAIASTLSVMLFTACQTTTTKTNILETNSLLKESNLPYGVPDFSQIKDEDFLPAMEYGIQEKLTQIDSIANNSAEPTFENVFIALEKAGATLSKVRGVFDMLTGANTNPTLQAADEELAPKLAGLTDAIFLNDKLFERVKLVHNQLTNLKLDSESERLVEYYYQRFIISGANLSSADKEKLKQLNAEKATLSTKFTNRLIDAAKNSALVVDTPDQLKGLSEGEINAAANKAAENGYQGKYLLPLQNTTQQPAFTNLQDRETREKLYTLSLTRAQKADSNDTSDLIIRIAEIRAEQAALLGFQNYAEWSLKDQMAKNPESVFKFLDKLVPASVANGQAEAKELQSFVKKDGANFDLTAYDWNYYAEKLRKEKYDLNEADIMPYFELFTVLEKGVFFAAEKLYGITFKRRTDIPVYNPDMRVYELFNQDSTTIGLFYCDYFKRDNKSGGAWMSNIVEQSKLLGTKPVIYNVCNFTKPDNGEPALITYDDVTTMFHEFGHALHGFFANQQYVSLSGTSVARDFVELPSQFNEHWALYPDVFKNYAVHYQTGEPMPDVLYQKIKNATTFNQGYALTEILAAAELDLQWHALKVGDKINNVDEFEEGALKRTNLYNPLIPPRYRSAYFLHIWGNGYAASYYAYLWAEMLDTDAFQWFTQNGGLTRENGEHFRQTILSQGNTKDYNEMYKAFADRDPDIKPMLRGRGLLN